MVALSLLSPAVFGQERPVRQSLDPPRAQAGENRITSVGSTVILDGSASVDPQGRPLTYQWSLTRRPQGSTAKFSNPNIPNPAFTIDVPGLYLAELVVSDGETSSTPVHSGNQHWASAAGAVRVFR